MCVRLLQETFGEVSDPLLRLPAYWADCEAHLAGDTGAARAVWEAVLKTAAGRWAQHHACDLGAQRGGSPACDVGTWECAFSGHRKDACAHAAGRQRLGWRMSPWSGRCATSARRARCTSAATPASLQTARSPPCATPGCALSARRAGDSGFPLLLQHCHFILLEADLCAHNCCERGA